MYKSFLLLIYIVAIYLFGLFIKLIILSEYIKSLINNQHEIGGSEFDYIIVGAGSAGSILARRLSDDKTTKILLLEAGSEVPGFFDIPPIGLMLQGTSFDWQYKITPQKHACFALENHVNSWPMGKLMGGSGRLNNLIYIRGHKNDFNDWYKSDPTFNYDRDILPYFKKLENWLPIENLPFTTQLSNAILEAGKSLGFLVTDGVNPSIGFAQPKATILNGKRSSSIHNLYKFIKRDNLHIRTNSLVEKVRLIGGYDAKWVNYLHFGKKYAVSARKGVILSAGTIGSPKILLQSGIGPKNHLKALKIKNLVDLPVGDNLQDHLTTGIDLILINRTLNLGIEQIISTSAIYNYFTKSSGPWTTIGCENVAFFATENQTTPNLQLMVLPLGVASDKGTFLAGLAGIGPKIIENYFNRIEHTSITILPIILHPKSRGTVRLINSMPITQPEINPNYLSDPNDIDVLLKGIELIKKLIKTPSMQRLGAKLNNLPFPGCEHFIFDTNAYWQCYIKQLTITTYHPIGTCSFGSVTNFDFSVKHTSRLFVIDGSSLPNLPTGNPNAAIMMMAEKGADSIKLIDWRNSCKCQIVEIFHINKSMSIYR